MDDDLVKRLRENSLIKQQTAWTRSDGGQDLSIGSLLADEAADRIEELEREVASRTRLVALREKMFTALIAERDAIREKTIEEVLAAIKLIGDTQRNNSTALNIYYVLGLVERALSREVKP